MSPWPGVVSSPIIISHLDDGVVPVHEGAVGPLPLPQDHVQFGVVRVGVEGTELVHVQGLGVDLGW